MKHDIDIFSLRYRMSQGDSNPAAIPHAAEDIQGDDRWMSQVKGSTLYHSREMSLFVFESLLTKAAKGVFLMVKKEFITVNKNLTLECHA